MSELHILLVDDQKLFVESLRRALEAITAPGTVISIAYDGVEAVGRVQEELPDIVIMDVHMPGLGGPEATREILRLRPGSKVIMLSAFGYDEYVRSAIESGASGYLLKDISPEELLAAVEGVHSGAPLVIAREVVNQGQRPATDEHMPKAVPTWFLELTDKERKILHLLARGYSNDEIAGKLNIGAQTTRNYVSTIYSKLGVENRFEAMRMAIESRIDSLPLLQM